MINLLLAAGILALSAATASATAIYINPANDPGPLEISDTFSVEIIVESQGDNLQVIGLSLSWNPAVLGLINILGGPCIATKTCASPSLFSGYGGSQLPRIATPGSNVIPGDPPGTIRFSGHFSAGGIESPYPSYYPGQNRIATVGYAVFHAIGNGASTITPLTLTGDLVGGVVGGVGGQDVFPTFGGLDVQVGPVIPEPASALLVCIGLGGLALAGRKLS
jgi:hypothetical protein